MAYQFDKDGKLKEPTAQELAAADADSSIIVLQQGILDDGRPYWAYIGVKPSKYKEFMRLTKAKQRIRMQDFGAILKHGFESEVPIATKEAMQQQYKCDDQYMANLTKEALADQAKFLKGQEDKRIGDIVAMLKQKK